MTKLCDKCEHKDVCKYCSIYEELLDRLVALNFGGKYAEIFSANLNCNKYSMEPSKLTETSQDWWLKSTDTITGITKPEHLQPYYTLVTDNMPSYTGLCKNEQTAVNFEDDLDE